MPATTALDLDYRTVRRAEHKGITLSCEQANILRRADLTLTRWAEGECGNGNDRASWCIERDEKTGKPYHVVYPHSGASRRYPIADREAGALRRVASLCKELGLYFFHQTDPRGAALWVSNEPLNDQNYTRGVACCGDGA